MKKFKFYIVAVLCIVGIILVDISMNVLEFTSQKNKMLIVLIVGFVCLIIAFIIVKLNTPKE